MINKELLKNFTAIDFETAHAKNWSICQVGLVAVENGTITREIEMLIKPPGNQYHWGNSRVHGINRHTTKNAPAFKDIWPQIEPYIAQQQIVAHNAPFDCQCLRSTLSFYDLPIPSFESHCTVQIYKKNLKALCEQYHIKLDHHNALSDARACALLFLKYLEGKN